MVAIRCAVVAVMIFLTGCTTTTSMMSDSSLPAYGTTNNAVSSLLEHAQSAQDKGDLTAADGWLVRAMRISPTEPAVYYRMALLRKEQGQPDQARQLASRALSLGPNSVMKKDLDQLLRQL